MSPQPPLGTPRAALGDEALRASEARYRELVEFVNDVVYSFDPATGQMVSVNGAVERVFGYTVEEALQRNIMEVLHPDDVPIAMRHNKAKKDGSEEGSVYEMRGLRKDRSTFWMEISSRAVRSGGQLVAIHGIIRDITARKVAEEAAKASEARYRNLIQDAVDVIYTHDAVGRFLDVNGAGIATYGYTRDEFAGMNIQQLVHPDDANKAAEAMQAKMSGKVETTGPYELRSLTKAGDVVWLEVTTRILRDGSQSVIQGIGRNVTARHQAEMSLALFNETIPRLRDLSVDDGLRLLLERIATTADWDYAEAWVPNGKGFLVASPAFFAARPGFERLRKLTEKMAFQRGEAVLGQFWEHPTSRWIPDLQKEPGIVRAATARAAGLTSIAMVPVLDGNRFVAGLALFQSRSSPKDQQRLQLAERVAALAAPAFARRQAEEELQHHLGFTIAQLTASPVALLIVDEEGTVVAVNPKMVALCGTSVRDSNRAVFDLGGRVAERMADPVRFTERVRDFYMSPDERLRIEGVEYDRLGFDLTGADGRKIGHVLYLRPKASASAAPPSRPRALKS